VATTATSLKLPSTLKAELDDLAQRSGETTHAVMVRAPTEHVAAAKRYRRFLDDAAREDVVMRENGVGYAMQGVHAYVLCKARGEKAKRPKRASSTRLRRGLWSVSWPSRSLTAWSESTRVLLHP